MHQHALMDGHSIVDLGVDVAPCPLLEVQSKVHIAICVDRDVLSPPQIVDKTTHSSNASPATNKVAYLVPIYPERCQCLPGCQWVE